jgi:toxin ParE1/3/4
MIRTVVKTLYARLGVVEIAERIAKDDPLAAERFVRAVDDSCRFLAEFPHSGDLIRTRKRRLKGLRAWQVKKFRRYVILYLSTDATIEILAVIHGMRKLSWIVCRL